MGPFNSCSSWCPSAFRGCQAALTSHGEHELPNAPRRLHFSWTKASASAASLPGAGALDSLTSAPPTASTNHLQMGLLSSKHPLVFFAERLQQWLGMNYNLSASLSRRKNHSWLWVLKDKGLPRVSGGTITASGVPMALKTTSGWIKLKNENTKWRVVCYFLGKTFQTNTLLHLLVKISTSCSEHTILHQLRGSALNAWELTGWGGQRFS